MRSSAIAVGTNAMVICCSTSQLREGFGRTSAVFIDDVQTGAGRRDRARSPRRRRRSPGRQVGWHGPAARHRIRRVPLDEAREIAMRDLDALRLTAGSGGVDDVGELFGTGTFAQRLRRQSPQSVERRYPGRPCSTFQAEVPRASIGGRPVREPGRRAKCRQFVPPAMRDRAEGTSRRPS